MKNDPAEHPQEDLFARIAMQRTAAQQHALIEPQPPVLPGELPAGQSNPQAAFTPQQKLDTPEKLQRELEKQRKRHAPYLRNLAPPLDAARITVPIGDVQLAQGNRQRPPGLCRHPPGCR